MVAPTWQMEVSSQTRQTPMMQQAECPGLSFTCNYLAVWYFCSP